MANGDHSRGTDEGEPMLRSPNDTMFSSDPSVGDDGH